MPYRGEKLIERDDEPDGPPRCRKCGARLRAAPDGYDYDRTTRTYALTPGVTPDEASSSGWTCGRCGHWQERPN